MPPTAVQSLAAERARELVRLLDRNDRLGLERELDCRGPLRGTGPELSSLEAERQELLGCIVQVLRQARPAAEQDGAVEAGIRLLRHLASSGQRTPATPAGRGVRERHRGSPPPGMPFSCRR